MDDLVMPQPFARAGVEREQAVAKEVGADAVGAVEVVGRRTGRRVNDAARSSRLMSPQTLMPPTLL